MFPNNDFLHQIYKDGLFVTAELYAFYSIKIHTVWQVVPKLLYKLKETEYFKLIRNAHFSVIWPVENKSSTANKPVNTFIFN